MFIQDKSLAAHAVYVQCLQCGVMVKLADAWIDTEGPAFKAYYHEACKDRHGARGES